jgi:hypothetical protein
MQAYILPAQVVQLLKTTYHSTQQHAGMGSTANTGLETVCQLAFGPPVVLALPRFHER